MQRIIEESRMSSAAVPSSWDPSAANSAGSWKFMETVWKRSPNSRRLLHQRFGHGVARPPEARLIPTEPFSTNVGVGDLETPWYDIPLELRPSIGVITIC